MNDCRRLLDKESLKVAPFLREDLERLLEFSEAAWAKFQEEVQPNMNDDSSLSGIMVIDKWQESRFSPEALLHHLNAIKENIKRVEWYIDDAEAEGLGVYLSNDIEHCADSFKDIIVSFTFNAEAFRSKDLKDAFDCLRNRDFDSVSSVNDENPDQIISELVSILIVFDAFVLYSKENCDEPNKKYAISIGSACRDKNLAYTSIFTIEGEKYFELPGKPNKPVYIENSKTSDSLMLKLLPPEAGEQNVTGYKLMVYEVGVLISTIDVPKKKTGPIEYLVEDLQPGMEYSFKLQSVSQAGCSPKSTMSEKVLLDSAGQKVPLDAAKDEVDTDSELSPDEIDTDGGVVVSAARSSGKPSTAILRDDMTKPCAFNFMFRSHHHSIELQIYSPLQSISVQQYHY
jgi:hypothetical protein